ncbi:MAG TPA: PH domain-containing protein [Mucilaginibacter sp.]
MSFIEKNLSANERIIYNGKIHWFIYFRGIFFIILGLLTNSASASASAFLFFVGIVILLMAIMIARSSEFAITNKRVVLKTGIFSRKLIELQLNKSEGLQISQGILGRLFNFGTIKITSGGVIEGFAFLANPFEFKKQVNNAVEDSFAVGGNPATI